MALNSWSIAYIQMNYPNLAWAINHPELGPILDQAVEHGWTEEIVVAKVKQTNWYRSTNDSQRRWELMSNDNPGQAAAELGSAVKKVQQIASRLGIAINGDQALWIGTAAISNGWTEEQITTNLVENYGGSLARPAGGAQQQGGLIGAYQDLATARAKEWGVPLSEESAFAWGKWLASGAMDQQGLDAHLRDWAMSRFPTLKSMYEMGFTTKQIFDPYIQQTAQLLELSPNMIDLTNQKWMPMIDSVSPEGVRRPMSLSEAGRFVRGMDEFNHTQQAEEQGARLAETILTKFGAVA